MSNDDMQFAVLSFCLFLKEFFSYMCWKLSHPITFEFIIGKKLGKCDRK